MNALVEFPFKELDSHDCKDQPEEETDQEDIDDGRNGVQKSIHNNLKETTVNSFSIWKFPAYFHSLPS